MKLYGTPGPRRALIAQRDQLKATIKAIEGIIRAQNELASKRKEDHPVFSASSDYRSITYKGAPYRLTRNQSTIIRMLHEAYLKGTPALGRDVLLSAIEAETSRVRDSFKSRPQLWNTLIIGGGARGTYQLNLK